MSKQLTRASVLSVAATLMFILFNATGTSLAAQQTGQSQPTQIESSVKTTPVPAADGAQSGDLARPSIDLDAAPAVNPANLAEMVTRQPSADEISSELKCLAGAVYFEARNESLEGQLAVARVIVARSRSGQFPSSYCGVVFQRSQFSFVRGTAMPVIKQTSPAWRKALAIAEIAHDGSWQSPAEGALFFHSVHVAPKWHRQRVARIDNHVFYRYTDGACVLPVNRWGFVPDMC